MLHNPMTISAIAEQYRVGDTTPRQLILRLLRQAKYAAEHERNPVWLHLMSAEEIEPYLARLEAANADSLPLFGIPFAIKDNIDLAGVPTTAACAEFAYTPEHSAFVVEQLIAAGAIPLGKTNLDQFATGLVGVRSPYGACKNALNPEYISGGSSSGSAVAVAKHWAAFSLGTDTAGSGRVPAALNHLVGLKPTRGLLSNRGLVPACRSLDCISIFAHTLEDAQNVFDVAVRFDALDPYSRANPYGNGNRYGITPPAECVIGVPRPSQLEFFGDRESEALFAEANALAQARGAQIKEIDFQPFLDAAKLLYEGPWVAERYLATQPLIEQNPQALLPVTRSIIAAGQTPSAAEAFSAQYALQACQQKACEVLAQVDCVMTPTIGTDYTIAEVEADPVRLNSNLGYYTNFMNLLDCAALAVPTAFKRSGIGFGVTLFHRAFADKRLLGYAHFLSQASNLEAEFTALPARPNACEYVDVVVCGAHLEGLALNWQLRERGAHLRKSTTTAERYRFYALTGGAIARPGLIRVEHGGCEIEVEVWRVPSREFGAFVAEIAAPLGIGKIELADGTWCTGFICEAYAIEQAIDITHLRGWRQYLASSE